MAEECETSFLDFGREGSFFSDVVEFLAGDDFGVSNVQDNA